MSDEPDQLKHIKTESNLVEDPEHEKGIKRSIAVIGFIVMIPIVAILVFLYSSAPR